MTKPNFIVIGAAKSGTTTLCELLAEHPDIFVSDPKEPQYFSHDRNYALGMGWYEQFFAEAGNARAIGEGSVNYTMLPGFQETAARIARDLPGARLIYIVRHPVERMISTWRMLIRDKPGTGSFEEEIAKPELSYYYVDRSRYWYQIQEYRQHFPDDQILVLFLDDFAADPIATLRRCYAFLDVQPDFLPETPGRKKNPSAGYRTDSPILQTIDNIPLLRLLKGLFPDKLRHKLRAKLTTELVAIPYCSQAKRHWLADQLRADTSQFLEFYGKPADFWRMEPDDFEKMFAAQEGEAD